MSAIDADMILVAEHGNGEVDRLERPRGAAVSHLGLGVFDAPARIVVLLPELGWLVSAVRDPAALDRRLLLLGITLLGRWDDGSVDNLSTHGEIARSLSAASKRAKSLSIALAFTSRSRNSRTVVASGTVPSSPKAKEALKTRAGP
jgi:hypothetical protein